MCTFVAHCQVVVWRSTPVFIAFAAYTNVDREQTYARYKYNGNGHIPVLIHY